MTVFADNRPLLDAFRRGERAALAQVFGAYVDDVATLVGRGFFLDGAVRVPGTGSTDALHDLVQDVFVRALAEKARLAYDGLRPYRPYLLRITKNVLIDRARRARPLLSLDAAAPGGALRDLDQLIDSNAALPHEPCRTPEEELSWREQRAATQAYMSGLSAEAAAFVQQRFVEELPLLEVARRLGLTRRQARTLEEQVLRGLEKHLRKIGG